MKSPSWCGGGILLVLAISLSSCYGLTVMSVDFGAEFMKVAVVAPGVPMEIALNKESKRKTPVAIAFRDGERTFGDDAITAGMRSPKSVFINLLHLLGKNVSHPIVTAYKQRYPHYDIHPHPTRATVVFSVSETESYTVEELIAQLLSHARDQASAHTGQKVKDLVITVPAFFNQAERRALLDAASIANLKVLSLMSSNAAVALNYGMFRRKEINETAQHLLFYDMGSSQTTATVISYQTAKTKERGYTETNPQLTVLGVGFDRTLGGYEMQLRLRDFLARKFNEQKKTKTDVFTNPRAMSKINKEAARLKRVLSANSEHVSQIENVMEDIDLRVMVTRAEFEGLFGDLVERSWGPVSDALVAAGLDISVLDQFVLVGGATRVPAVQEYIQAQWGRELSRNINADEAAALGAVYRAADIGQGFKVKTFHVKECNLYPIEVEFDRISEQADGSMVEKAVKRSLFAVGNYFPQKKLMTFNKNIADFAFRVNYGDMTESMVPSKIRQQFGSTANLSYALVRGVASTYQEYVTNKENTDFKGIKAHFSLDPSGILRLGDVELVVERNITVEETKSEEPKLEDKVDGAFAKIGDTLNKLFGGDEDDEVNTTADGDKPKTIKVDLDDLLKGKDAKDSKDDSKDTKDVKEKKTKIVTDKIILKTTEVALDLATFSGDIYNASVAKLDAINALEAERERRAVGRNNLETLLLDIRDKMTQDEYIKASVEKDQATLTEKCNTLEDWLYEDGFDAEATTYDVKIGELMKVFEPISDRVDEHRQRPQAIKALSNMMNMSSDFLQRARGAPEAEEWFTSVELQKLDDLIVSTQSWVEYSEEAQDAVPASQDPSMTLAAIGDKMADIDREMKYLVNKAKLAKAKADREAAEAKVKAEKAAKDAEKAEKAEKKKKKKAAAAANETQEAKQDGDDVSPDTSEDTRQEPVLPEDTRQEEDISPDPVQEEAEETHTEL